MTGVDNLDPNEDGVEESQSSLAPEGDSASESGTEFESRSELEIGSGATNPESPESEQAGVVPVETLEDSALNVASAATPEHSVGQGQADSNAEDVVVQPDHIETGTQEAITPSASPAPRNATVSPTPIPILDRPPSTSYDVSSTKDVNSIYDDVDTETEREAASSGNTVNDAYAPDTAGTDTDSAGTDTDSAGTDTAGTDTAVLDAGTDLPDYDATTVIDRVAPDATLQHRPTEANTQVSIPVIDTPPARTSYKARANNASDLGSTQVPEASGGEASTAALQSSENDLKQEQSGVGVAVKQDNPLASESRSNSIPVVQSPSQPNTEQNILAGFEDEKSGRGGVKAGVAIFATLIVLGGGYVGAQFAFADQIAKNVSVAGVEIGGLTQPAASAVLDEQLKPKLDEKMTLHSGEVEASLVPVEAGVTLDVEATLEDLTGFSWSPSVLWKHLAGGEPIEPVLNIDEEAFAAAAEEVSGAFYVEPVNGSVAFVDARAVSTAAEDGSGVEPNVVADLVKANLFTDQRPVEISAVPVAPEVTQDATNSALEIAETIASAAVTVTVDGQSAEIPQEAFTEDVSVKFVDGAAQFAFDGEKLSDDVVKRTTDLLKESEDARFVFVDGKPEIETGEAGTTIDQEALSSAFLTAATSQTNRVVEAVLVETDPERSVEKLEKLGVKELVASFSTPITNESLRTANLKVAAERITGYLVEPGKQFDLLKVIGPVTAANGYHSAGVIVNGIHTDGVGGGLSQVATTTYNAGFFAGMTDIAHRPHSVWFKRYPEGRESTMFVGSIDMIWQNDSETGILMRSYVAGGKLTVEAWGTKTYKVETTTSPRSNVRAATMTTSTDPKCSFYPVGQPGFTVTVSRKVTELVTGEVVKDEANSWTYRPDNGVTCKKEEPKKEKAQEKSKND